MKGSPSPQSNTDDTDTTTKIALAVVIPVIGVGAIILGVLLGLRRQKQNKSKRIDYPISLLPRTDKRLIPYNSVTLEKEIGAGSYGKGIIFSLIVFLN